MGKGDKYRPVDKEKYAENYDRIFGEDEEEDPDPDQQEEAERE